MSIIAKNLEDVNRRIARAAVKAGKTPEDITLVAVSKTIEIERMREAYNFGVRNFGENKVQELVKKVAEFSSANDEPQIGNFDEKPIWHMIGRLQTNKAKIAAESASLIHSVDSMRLADELNRRANSTVNILLQVNVSEEATKAGVNVESVEKIIHDMQKLPNLCIKGLMTIAPPVENPEENRQFFVKMNKIYIDIRKVLYDNGFTFLSMGMTSDFEVAIEEGANIVRIGTGIFGER
ncbi:MAG: YggS family pyridoxal phosphate-dependent enzyme [Defluviitaleaceae bacterium]|nr:YggS family pyridoxal phosphate-dependent enzyme [Defluviitaleaceae bacterium]